MMALLFLLLDYSKDYILIFHLKLVKFIVILLLIFQKFKIKNLQNLYSTPKNLITWRDIIFISSIKLILILSLVKIHLQLDH